MFSLFAGTIASWRRESVRELALLDLWHALNKKLLLISQIQL